MRTVATIYTPRDVDERQLAEWLERQFDAGWFPDTHRFSMSTDDAVAVIDLDRDGAGGLPPDEVRAVGFVPKAVLYVSAVVYYTGSVRLAERVTAAVAQHLGGRVLAAAPLDLTSGSRS